MECDADEGDIHEALVEEEEDLVESMADGEGLWRRMTTIATRVTRPYCSNLEERRVCFGPCIPVALYSLAPQARAWPMLSRITMRPIQR